MAAGKKRIRKRVAGFVGIQLGREDNMSLYNRLEEEVKITTMNRSMIIRLALIDYFEKKDGKKLEQ